MRFTGIHGHSAKFDERMKQLNDLLKLLVMEKKLIQRLLQIRPKLSYLHGNRCCCGNSYIKNVLCTISTKSSQMSTFSAQRLVNILFCKNNFIGSFVRVAIRRLYSTIHMVFS